MKPIIRIFFALSFCLNLLSVRAAVLTVTNIADSGMGSLRDTLAAAQSGDTITFDTSLAGQTILLTNGELVVNGLTNLTIDASALPDGVVIDVNYASRVFDVTNHAAVTLAGLTVAHGYFASGDGTGMGGGIINGDDCVLTLNDCTLAGNAADYAGGGIYNNTGTVTLNRCTVNGNYTGYNGSGGGIYNESGTLTVNGSTFTGNVVQYGLGGGIYNGGTLLVAQSTLTGNLDNYYGSGGGIYNRGGLTLFNTMVVGNIGYGATNIDGDYTNLGVNVVDEPVALAPLGNYGGLTQTMPPLAIATNVIDQGDDAAINAPYAFTTDQRGLPRRSGAHVDIGAVEWQTNEPHLALVTTTADAGPGSLREVLTQVTNDTTILFVPEMSWQTIWLSSGELMVNGLTNLTIDAASLGSNIVVNGQQISRVFNITNHAAVTLKNLTIASGSVADDDGGGILNNAGCTLMVTNCVIAGNTAGYNGGGIRNRGTLILSAVTLDENSAASGGGIFNDGTLTMNSGVLNGGYAQYTGGGIHNEYSSTVTLSQVTVSANFARYGGGGLYNYGTLVVAGSTLVGNGALYNGGGGGIYNSGILTVNESTVAANTSVYGGLGGGLYNQNVVVLNQTTVSGNYMGVNGYGGGIYNVGSLTLFNSIVAGNSAPGAANLAGNYMEQGANVVDAPVALAPLGNYGGPTLTIPPLATATNIIDQGDDAATNAPYNFTTDQRGYSRLSGAHVDIGAVELQVASQPPILTALPASGGGGNGGGGNGENNFQIGFTSAVQKDFTIYGSTNLTLPFAQWQNLGRAVETPAGSGQYEFADPQSAAKAQSFYRATSP